MFSTKIKWFFLAGSRDRLISEIPEKGFLRSVINQKSVCVFVYENEIFAVRDKCPHQGYAFSKGACLEEGKIVCPLHKYAFDLKNGRGAGMYLEIFPIEFREDGVYLGMEYFSWF